MTLDEARDNIGGSVLYDPGHGTPEPGTITGISADWVFVQYGESRKATPPERLSLHNERPVPAHYAEVVTRYGGHKHLAITDPSVTLTSRHFTACHATSAWTVESWEANPDHPFLSLDSLRALPRCSECWSMVRP